eukprot:gene16107-11526_t
MSSWRLFVRFVSQNHYNLSRPEFARLRRHQDAAQPAEAHKCLEHIERAELTSCKGIAWINRFLDLIYVIVTFKINDVLLQCSPQRNRVHDPQAATIVCIVAISFFVQMLFITFLFRIGKRCASRRAPQRRRRAEATSLLFVVLAFVALVEVQFFETSRGAQSKDR